MKNRLQFQDQKVSKISRNQQALVQYSQGTCEATWTQSVVWQARKSRYFGGIQFTPPCPKRKCGANGRTGGLNDLAHFVHLFSVPSY